MSGTIIQLEANDIEACASSNKASAFCSQVKKAKRKIVPLIA